MLINFKALHIIATFNEKDYKDFKKFLQSPFLNSRKKLVDLFSYVQKFEGNWNDSTLSYENIFAQVYPNEIFDRSLITKLFSSLYKSLETYLVYKNHIEDEINDKLLLLKYYNKHQLDELYNETEKDIEKQLLSNHNSDYYLTNLLMNIEKCSHASTVDKRIGDINYQQTSTALDIYFIYTKLKLVCLMLNRALIVSVKYDINLMNEMKDEQLIKSFESQVINVYFLAYQLLMDPTSLQNYVALKNYLIENSSQLQKNDISQLYTYLENCTNFVYTDKLLFYENLFEIYERQIQNRSEYYFDSIHRSILKNIITVALKLNKTEWAESFLKEHKKKIIPEENASEIYYFCLSEIYFTEGRYDDSLVSLAKIKPQDIFIKLSLKRMYLKIYYETKAFNLLDSNINSYRVYLSREVSLTADKLQNEKNFVNAIQKMMKLKLERKENQFTKLKSKLALESMSDKSWIDKQLAISFV